MENKWLIGVTQWGTYIVSLLVVLSPFIYLSIRKFKKRQAVSIALAILSFVVSFILFFSSTGINYIIDGSTNNLYMSNALSNASVFLMFSVIIIWPLLSILVVRTTRNKFTFLNSLFSTVFCLAMFAGLVYLWIWVTEWGLGQVGANYF